MLRLQDNDGRSWLEVNQPFARFSIRRGVPEQSWLTPKGEEVLTTARLLRDDATAEINGLAVSLRSGRGRARLDRDRSDLVATVAHELRSPLTGVKGFVQAMLNRWDKLSDEQKKLMLTTVHSDSDRLSRLIAELLDVARIDTGRLSLYPRPCDADVLVGRVVESVRAGTARTIDYAPADDLPQIAADPDKFTQVVTNIVENAVRHGDGVVTVTLAARGDGRRRASGWSSRTREAGSPRRCGAGCSPSSGPAAYAGGPASGCTSSTASPAPTAAASRSATPSPAAPGSSSSGRPPRSSASPRASR